MANKNPIQVNKPFEETEYVVPKKYNKTMIYLTLNVELEEEGWLYASAHSIFLSGTDKYPDKTPEPSDLKLSHGEFLNGERLAILSHISRIKEDSDTGVPPVIKYSLTIEAGDILLDLFEAKSGIENPTDFKSLILFKIEQ
jgi:hypothetical protein